MIARKRFRTSFRAGAAWGVVVLAALTFQTAAQADGAFSALPEPEEVNQVRADAGRRNTLAPFERDSFVNLRLARYF